jgi:hypothetical protein
VLSERCWNSFQCLQTEDSARKPGPGAATEKRVLVEAAGVEPASEKVRHAVTTCVSDSLVVGRLLWNQQDTSGLVRLVSISRLRTEAFDPACKKDAYRPGHRRPDQGGYLIIRQRMQTACWQLLVFRSFYGSSEPGTPQHNESIPSKPSKILIFDLPTVPYDRPTEAYNTEATTHTGLTSRWKPFCQDHYLLGFTAHEKEGRV